MKKIRKRWLLARTSPIILMIKEAAGLNMVLQLKKNMIPHAPTPTTLQGAMQPLSSQLIRRLKNKDQGLNWTAPFKIWPLPQWPPKRKWEQRKGRVK